MDLHSAVFYVLLLLGMPPKHFGDSCSLTARSRRFRLPRSIEILTKIILTRKHEDKNRSKE